MTWRVYVDRQAIAHNKSTGEQRPVLLVEDPHGVVSGHLSLELPAGSRVVYRPGEPRSGGAVVWVECASRPV